jgi:protein ImuB
MFACLCLVSSHDEHPVEALLQLAGDFSPRYEMVRPHLVVVEIGGLGRLLGTPREIGDAFCRLARERGMVVSIGIAATYTAALLLALNQAAKAFADPLDAGCLTVVPPGREAEALAPLPLTLLSVLPDDRLSHEDVAFLRRRIDRDPLALTPARAPQAGAAGTGPASPRGMTRGWRGRGSSEHYRLAPAPLAAEDPSPENTPPASGPLHSTTKGEASTRGGDDERASLSSGDQQQRREQREAILEVLRRWGLKTLGELARLPAAGLFERLGRDGMILQQIARGLDTRPLVPTIPGEPFEATVALDWPIEALEPLSFVLTRLLEPLCTRLERCDRGAAVLQVTLQLVTRQCHTRRLELPAPMRDPKVLRTLVLLDLESHPPDAGIDQVTLTIQPTPGRIVQHSLLMRALPSPEQLSTLTARLSAVMGEGRVGAPALVDTHRPEAFVMCRFEATELAGRATGQGRETTVAYGLRRFRRMIPARVSVAQGRPVHVTPQGLPGGRVMQAAGPWRTSGEWWKSRPSLQPLAGMPPQAPRPGQAPDVESWDRDEWDVALDNGSLYRIHLDHRHSRWFAEAALD